MTITSVPSLKKTLDMRGLTVGYTCCLANASYAIGTFNKLFRVREYRV